MSGVQAGIGANAVYSRAGQDHDLLHVLCPGCSEDIPLRLHADTTNREPAAGALERNRLGVSGSGEFESNFVELSQSARGKCERDAVNHDLQHGNWFGEVAGNY